MADEGKGPPMSPHSSSSSSPQSLGSWPLLLLLLLLLRMWPMWWRLWRRRTALQLHQRRLRRSAMHTLVHYTRKSSRCSRSKCKELVEEGQFKKQCIFYTVCQGPPILTSTTMPPSKRASMTGETVK